MKKIVLIAIAAAFCFAISACGTADATAPAAEASAAPTVSEQSSEEPSAAVSEQPKKPEKSAEQNSAQNIDINSLDIISYEEAVNISIDDLNSQTDVIPLSCSIDYGDVSLEYDVDLADSDGYIYEYEINAEDGAVLRQKQNDDFSAILPTDVSVSYTEAVKTALNSVDGTIFESFDLENTADGLYYEVEVTADGRRSKKIYVDAQTGEILESGSRTKNPKNNNSSQSTTDSNSDAITEDEARQIALDAVGSGTVNSSYYDRSDAEYEVYITDSDGSDVEVTVSSNGRVLDIDYDGDYDNYHGGHHGGSHHGYDDDYYDHD